MSKRVGSDPHGRHTLKRPRSDRRNEVQDDGDSDGTIDYEFPVAPGPEQASIQNVQAAVSGGDGGGSNFGGVNTAEQLSRFCMERKGYTKRFRRSFQVVFDSGLSNANFGVSLKTGVDGVAGNCVWTEWCEGWQIVPYGFLSSCVTFNEYFHIMTNSRRWRIKNCGFELEDITAFSQQLVGGGEKAVTMNISNRPTIHYYVDDGSFLPLETNVKAPCDLVHSRCFSTVYTNHEDSKLVCPKFKFSHMNYKLWPHLNLKANESPSAVFSLYDTGRVKVMRPGEKFHHHFEYESDGWNSGRPVWDNVLTGGRPLGEWDGANFVDGKSPANEFYKRMLSAYESPLNVFQHSRIANIGGVASDGLTDVLLGGNPLPNFHYGGPQYLDTGKNLKQHKMPYVLLKMEPYFTPGNDQLVMYCTATISYTMEIEIEPLEGFGPHYLPLNIAAMGASFRAGDITSDDFRAGIYAGTISAPSDNLIDHRTGVYKDDVVAYT